MTPAALICDTSGLLAFFNDADPDHQRVVTAVAEATGPLVLSPYVLAELDYLVASRLGVTAELAVLEQVWSGAFEFPLIAPSDVRRMASVISRYSDQQIGLADASLVVLADIYGTTSLLTLDHHHFRVIRPLAAEAFALLP